MQPLIIGEVKLKVFLYNNSNFNIKQMTKIELISTLFNLKNGWKQNLLAFYVIKFTDDVSDDINL